MGGKFATISLVALGTVFTYQILSHASGATSIIGTSFKGLGSLFKTMQGR